MPEPLEQTQNSRISLGLTSGMALTAWACIIAATSVCDFVKLEAVNLFTNETETLYRGLWRGQSGFDDGCGSYQGVYRDTRWFTAETFSIFACVVGFCSILPLLVACGKKLFVSQVMGMAGGCLKASLCSGLTLLFQGSSACRAPDGFEKTSCKHVVGANLCIAATVLFAVAGCAINCSIVAATKMQEIMQGQNGNYGGDEENGGKKEEEGTEEAA